MIYCPLRTGGRGRVDGFFLLNRQNPLSLKTFPSQGLASPVYFFKYGRISGKVWYIPKPYWPSECRSTFLTQKSYIGLIIWFLYIFGITQMFV